MLSVATEIERKKGAGIMPSPSVKMLIFGVHGQYLVIGTVVF